MPGPYVSEEDRERASATAGGRLATGLAGLAVAGVVHLLTKDSPDEPAPEPESEPSS